MNTVSGGIAAGVPAVMGMFGVGPTLDLQLIAEISNVWQFHSQKALLAFVGIRVLPYNTSLDYMMGLDDC